MRLGKVQREVLRLASLSGPGWEGLPVGYGMGETRRVTGGDLPLHVSERRAYLILQRLRELDLVEPVYHERFPGMEDYYRATPEGRALLTRRFDDPYTD